MGRKAFQSTRPRGARLSVSLPGQSIRSFQSTRPRGARRHTSRPIWRVRTRFNPRARVGRDSDERTTAFQADVFQSTRPRGARRGPGNGYTAKAAFQSTRPRGARRWTTYTVAKGDRFQSTRPRGARLYVFNHQKFCSITKPFSTNLPKRSLRKRHSFSSKIICNVISNCCCLREPSGFLGGLEVLASENQCSLGIIRRFCAYMFDVPPPLIPKDIKAQAVLRFIHFFHKGCS